MPAPLQKPNQNPTAHSLLDDLQGLSLGCFLTGLGFTFLTHLGLLTGQIAGLALLISYATEQSFGLVFFLINLPFYLLAYLRLGLAFTLKSISCVTTVSFLSEWLPQHVDFTALTPAIGACAFGALVGLGLLACFRHNASLGGLGVMALVIQDKTGFRAGYVQIIFDAVLFSFAAFLFPLETILYSLLGAMVLNGVIAFNHRTDRYRTS